MKTGQQATCGLARKRGGKDPISFQGQSERQIIYERSRIRTGFNFSTVPLEGREQLNDILKMLR